MDDSPQTREQQLQNQVRELKARLEVTEQTLAAIRDGELDALVIGQPGAEQIYTLRGADNSYRAFVEVMCEGAATIGEDGVILFCNRCMADLLGASTEELIGAFIYDFIAAGDEGLLRAALWHGMSESVRKRCELHLRDGTRRSVMLTATPLNVDDVASVCLVLTDLTEHEARTAAESASRAKDQFLAALSHELRTPLTPALMMLSTLEADRSLPQEVRDDLSLVRRNVELETKLIDDLLDLSRVRSGKLILRAELVSLHEVIRQVVQMYDGELTQKSLDVRCDLAAADDQVTGDPARLHQVIWNILKNAIKFSSEGGNLLIRTSNSPAGDALQIDICDHGRGISAEMMARIFNPFEQAGVHGQRQESGLGLGLAIARAIVELHKGQIEAHSDGLGHGATFTVKFPLARPADGTSSPKDAQPRSTSAAGNGHGDGAIASCPRLPSVGASSSSSSSSLRMSFAAFCEVSGTRWMRSTASRLRSKRRRRGRMT